MPPRLREGLLAEFGPSRGGLITPSDLEHARVIECAPHRIEVEGWTLATSPRLGGRLVGMIATQALAGPPPASELDALLGFARASRAGHLARSHLGSTTHVSVVDAEGCAATVTLTSGEGCGHVVTGTGVHVNNFLGEEDLNPAGFHRHAAGAALPTMIAPSIALDRSGRVIALGTGGANRIRSAVARVFAELVRGATLDHAIAAPRLHAEAGPSGSEVWFEREGMHDAGALERALAAEFETLHAFEGRDFFFGGVHSVERTATGRLHGVGDARRFGVARTLA
jgi:gamma-glutamyltranspeptidase/glutathione hydrolase